MIRAQYIRFTKDDCPMAPGRASAPIKSAHVPRDPKNPGAHSRVDERMDEIVIGDDGWVTLKARRRDAQDGKERAYTRRVSPSRVIDYEPEDEERKK